ncbi:MAG: ABC transporter ATP-binding protein [Brevundimonas sp.]|uniref:ABC transporter ATP-binding protein n=1 Tax=Brevundimonas sp. TaxID=1871086 RepID=UPI0025C70271|nr:ABC transporter ATP-binding protein [Brevundimonas sp.]MBX3476760.1 ABC transporter ATP-binding protein [Brevundimonas sp.]
MNQTETPPDAAPANAIEIRGLKKTYAASRKAPPKTALKGVDLTIPRGSMFGLLGPNGAGKSTLINILAGVVNKSEGEVRIWGRDIDRSPRDARAALGVVPQEIVADVFFTPREALEVQAGFYGVPGRERRSDELLAAVGLSDKADAYVRALSGGMKRRLMVAKAMVHSPPVLILDEPTAGVDVELRRQLWAYVRRLNAEGVTVVLTTHYLEEAQELCDQIAIVNRGEIVACEPTPQLLRRLDTRNVVVTPEGDLAAPPALEGFDVTARSGGAFAVTYRKGRSSVEQVISAVRAAGVTIGDITTEDPDLEDVFLALTYGDASQPDPTKD